MKQIIANEEITATSVRLVGSEMSGIMEKEYALEYAYSKDLDLVQISDQEIPVVKVLDLNKYLYEMKQEQKLNEKKQRVTTTQLKEVQFSTDTQENDLNVKMKSVQKFISSGKQVKIVMKVIGRINSNKDIIKNSINKMNAFLEKIDGIEFVQNVQIQGTNIVCTIKNVKQK